MSESCVVDISFRSQKSKIKFDNDKNENSLTVDLGKWKNLSYEDSLLLIEFELGEVRFSITEEEMCNQIKNFVEITKNSKEI